MTTPLMMAAVAILAGAIDPTELERMRLPLDAYLSRIETVHIRYTEHWRPGPEFENRKARPRKPPPELSPKRQRAMEDFRKKQAARGESEVVTRHDLLSAYPSFKLLSDAETKYADGSVDETHREQYAHAGRLLIINRAQKHAQNNALGDVPLQLRNPLNALGYRLPVTLNVRVSEILRFPEITTQLDTESVGGISAVVVRVGPELPASVRKGPIETDEMWYQLWLDPDRGFLPVRIDLYVENGQPGAPGFSKDRGIAVHRFAGRDGGEREFLRYRIEAADFAGATDSARGEPIPFPRRASFEDGAGAYLWDITDVEVNVPVSDADFQPTVPDDYTLVQDGELRRAKMSGGVKGRKQRFDDEARKAREAIAASIPENSSNRGSFGIGWRVAAPLLLAIIVVLLLVVRQRSG
jgi:hypothetical protein